MEREHNIDLIKIISSFLILIFHIVNIGVGDNIKDESLIIYYIGTFAITLFFMTNGYLILKKDKIDKHYIYTKIKKIFLFVVKWNILYSIMMFIIKGTFPNFLINSWLNLLYQQGYFFNFGFLVV